MTRRKPHAMSKSQSGKASRKSSPWNKGPLCSGQKARNSFAKYRDNPKE